MDQYLQKRSDNYVKLSEFCRQLNIPELNDFLVEIDETALIDYRAKYRRMRMLMKIADAQAERLSDENDKLHQEKIELISENARLKDEQQKLINSLSLDTRNND